MLKLLGTHKAQKTKYVASVIQIAPDLLSTPVLDRVELVTVKGRGRRCCQEEAEHF